MVAWTLAFPLDEADSKRMDEAGQGTFALLVAQKNVSTASTTL